MSLLLALATAAGALLAETILASECSLPPQEAGFARLGWWRWGSCLVFLAGFLAWRRAEARRGGPQGVRIPASGRARRRRLSVLLPYGLAACAGFSLAMARGGATLSSPLRVAAGRQDAEVALEVRVTGLVRASGDLVLVPARAVVVRGRGDVPAPFRGTLELRIPASQTVGANGETKAFRPGPGDVLSVLGRLYLPEPQMNPYEHDARRALVRSGVAARCGVIEFRPGPRWWPGALAYAPLRVAQWCRDRLVSLLETGLSPPSSGLARAFLLGDKTGFGQDERSAFERTGSLHLLAVSGLHAGLFAGFVGWLAGLLRLTPRGRAVVTSAALGAYVLVTGSSPAVLRAAVMAWSALWRPAARPGGDAVGYLGTAGLALLALDPLTAGDASFQLSFLATLGIISWPRLLPAPWPGTPRPRPGAAVLRGFTAGLGAQFCTLPVVLHCFYRFCPYAPVMGLLLLPVGGAVICLLFGAATAGLLCPPAFGWIGWAVDLMLRAFMWLVRLLSGFPGALVTTGHPSPVFSVAALIAILWGSLLARGNPPHAGSSAHAHRRGSAAPAPGRGLELIAYRGPLLAALAAALLCGQAVWRHVPGEEVSVAWFSVGQGDAALIRCAGQAVLVDFGPPGPPGWDGGDEFSKVVLPFLTATRCGPSFAILSHPHADHIGGLKQAMQAFPEMIVLTRQEFAVQVGEWVRTGDSLPQPNHPDPGNLVFLSEAYACLELGGAHAGPGGPGAGGARIELFPAPGGSAGDNLNERSLLARVIAGGTPVSVAGESAGDEAAFVLFAGDLGEEAESRLLGPGGPSLRAQVLKVAHHGSGGSSSSAFLERVRPQLAVVSVGVNGFGHPSRAALLRLRDRGALVLRTDEVGWIQVKASGRQLRVQSFRGLNSRQGTDSALREQTIREGEGCRAADQGLTPRPCRSSGPGRSGPCMLYGVTPTSMGA